MNRRQFLAAMAAGAVVTAEGLWMPGQKLISIPKKIQHYTVDFIGPGDQVLAVPIGPNYSITVNDLYRRLSNMLDLPQYMDLSTPMIAHTSEFFTLTDDWRIREYNHLTSGTIIERQTDAVYSDFDRDVSDA